MDHKKIIQDTIQNGDQFPIPVSFWRHFPVDDQNPFSLAKSTIEFQNLFDFDFVKVSPSSSFCLKDWGANDLWKGNSEGTRDYKDAVIKQPDDWLKLRVLDPNEGSLGKQLECLSLIKKNLDSNTPFIQTIFSPLAQAKNLAGKINIFYHIREFPEQLKAGLKTIVKTTQLFILECQKIGVDGIFYALQHASFDLMSMQEFREFGLSFDSELFELVNKFWFNVLHIHGTNIMFDLTEEYPFRIINWHDRETSPELKEARARTDRILCGGLGRIETMVLGNEEKIRQEFEDSVLQTKAKRFILGTGCVLPLTTPMGNIFAAVNFAHKFSGL